MAVRVIEPPAPIVTPATIPGGHGPDDTLITALIAAVTEEIDGPHGWLGRAIGPQTLEMTVDCWGAGSFRLPYQPIIETISLIYTDASGADVTVDAANYALSGNLLWFRPVWSAPSVGGVPDPIRIRYRAGYDGLAVVEGGTGPVPERIKAAIILMVQDLVRSTDEGGRLRSETVEGVGSQSFIDQDKVSALVQRRADSLLQGLRVYSL